MRIERGRIETPYRGLLYGTSGIGKTTFGAHSEDAVFLAAEEGANELDVARLRDDDGKPLKSYDQARDAVSWLSTSEEHKFKTLVIDTADWLGHWIEDWVCEKNNWSSIESPGYGKGFAAANEEWRHFLHALEKLQQARRMHVMFLGHANVKRYNPPDLEPYDRYSLKMHDGAAALLMEWCHWIFFAKHEVVVPKKEGEVKQQRGYDTGKRIIVTNETAAERAKNRYCMPKTITFDRDAFKTFEKYRKQDPATAFEALLAEAPKAKEKETELREWFQRQPDKLFAVQRMKAKLTSKEGE